MEWFKDKIKKIFSEGFDRMYTNWSTTKEQRDQLSQQQNDGGELPDKCDICGLRASYLNSDDETHAAILKAAKLQHCGLATNYPRIINVSVGDSHTTDYAYFCALSNLRYWNKPTKKCPDWQLKINEQLVLKDYLSIHQARNNRRIAITLGIWGSILTIINMLSK